MEEVNVFECLDRLEEEACNKSHKEKTERERVHRQKQQEQKYKELELKKKKLEEKLEHVEESLKLQSENALGSLCMSRLEDYPRSYRLIGLCTTRMHESMMLFRFETSFGGRFFEPYFLELVTKTNGMSIRSYTLPAFIPLHQLVEEYLRLASDTPRFLQLISEHLLAYVRRREDLKIAQEVLKTRGYIKGEINCSFAADVMQFYTERDTLASPSLNITLTFDNLLHLRPNLASVKARGSAEGLEKIEEWQNLLRSGTPSKTLSELCPERNGQREETESEMDDSD